MTKEELAHILTGRNMGEEISKGEEASAQLNGLVVVFGGSDDLIEFRGAIHDEGSCYDGGDVFVTSKGPLPDHDSCDCDFCGYPSAKSKAKKIEALWCEEEDYSWTYKTSLPHAKFEIVEDAKPYCRGIVFEVKDLAS